MCNCCEVICPYIGKCTDYTHKCGRCRHNTGKKSYFEDEWGYHQWYTYPYFSTPYRITCSGNTTLSENSITCTSYYSSE